MIGKLIIKTKTYCSINMGKETELYLENDVPVDKMGLPYIPLAKAFKTDDFDLSIGIAHLENYKGLLSATKLISNVDEVSEKIITSIFTKIVKDKNEKFCKVLKPNLTFNCPIEVKDSDKEKVEKNISSINKNGLKNDYFNGKVDVSVVWESKLGEKETASKLSKDKKYSRINYSLEIIDPLCVYSPYERSFKSKTYIPGSEIFDYIYKHATAEEQKILFGNKELKCSNAYPSCGGKRGIVAPVCMAVEKLNKNRLWYKLSTEPKDNVSVQTVRISGNYVNAINEKTVTKFEVENAKIHPLAGENEKLCGDIAFRDAIKEGQVFKGYFVGSDEQIRILYKIFTKNEEFNLGFYKDEGYGRVAVSIDNVAEKINEPEFYANVFDLFCVAPVIMYNSNGHYTYDANTFLSLIEKHLGVKDKLEIVTKMIDSEIYYPLNSDMEFTSSAIRCMAAGTCFRIKTKDSSMIDISKLKDAFVGSKTLLGFGEITAELPYEEFFRTVAEKDVDSYVMDSPKTSKDLQVMSNLNRELLKSILYSKISKMAIIDSKDSSSYSEIPMFALRHMADEYAPYLSDGELETAYTEVLNYVAD